VAAIRAEELDLFAPKFLVVTIKFAFALRASHPENFRHDSSWYGKEKSEIRISKSETNRGQINSKSENPKQRIRSFPFGTL
jgi:hypothetical protein